MGFSRVLYDRRGGDTNEFNSRKGRNSCTNHLNNQLINYKNDWIVDSGYSNHIIGGKEKFYTMEKYKSRCVMVTANNSKMPITHIGKALVVPHFNSTKVELDHVLHMPGTKKNLLSVSQLTLEGNHVIFNLDDVKVYWQLMLEGEPIIEGSLQEKTPNMTYLL
jgi:hypothetical protein